MKINNKIRIILTKGTQIFLPTNKLSVSILTIYLKKYKQTQKNKQSTRKIKFNKTKLPKIVLNKKMIVISTYKIINLKICKKKKPRNKCKKI